MKVLRVLFLFIAFSRPYMGRVKIYRKKEKGLKLTCDTLLWLVSIFSQLLFLCRFSNWKAIGACYMHFRDTSTWVPHGLWTCHVTSHGPTTASTTTTHSPMSFQANKVSKTCVATFSHDQVETRKIHIHVFVVFVKAVIYNSTWQYKKPMLWQGYPLNITNVVISLSTMFYWS